MDQWWRCSTPECSTIIFKPLGEDPNENPDEKCPKHDSNWSKISPLEDKHKISAEDQWWICGYCRGVKYYWPRGYDPNSSNKRCPRCGNIVWEPYGN